MGLELFEGPTASPWGVILWSLYLVSFLLVIVELGLICCRGARLRSFHGAFLGLSVCFLPMRLAVLATTGTDAIANEVLVVLYFAPTCLQCAAFSLWGLFLHTASQQQLGLHATRSVLAWYFVSNGILVVVNITEIALTLVLSHGDTVARFVQIAQNAFRGSVYCILAVLVAVYSWKFARLPQYLYHQSLLPSRPAILGVINAVLVAVFALRALYDFVSLGDWWQLPNFPPVEPATFAFFTLVEVVPLLSLLFVFGAPLLCKTTPRQPSVWDERFIVDSPHRPSVVGGASTSDGPPSAGVGPFGNQLMYGDEADLFLYATDDSFRRGLVETPSDVGPRGDRDGVTPQSMMRDSSFTTGRSGSTSRSRPAEMESVSSSRDRYDD